MKHSLNQEREIKVFFTGGHARVTGLSVAEEILRRHKNWKLYWVGSRVSHVGKSYKSLESQIFPEMGIEFLPLFAGRLQRSFTFWTIPEILKVPVGFLHAFYYILKYKPDVLVSFGSFTALPLIIPSKLLGIPILIHEQTAAIGRANKFSLPFANKVALARASSVKFVGKKADVIGNPVSSDIRQIKPKKEHGNPPTLLITGGASGAKKINDTISIITPELLEKFKVIHQVGDLEYDKFLSLKRALPENLQSRYEVYATLVPHKMHEKLNMADIVISRAGANIVSELMVIKKPSILIPLPIAYEDEQNKNALIAKEFGIASVITQKSLTGKVLKDEVLRVLKNWENIVRSVEKNISPDLESHNKLADLIEELIS